MAQKTIRGNETLARQIKSRRGELGLTIEEAASRAGVGTKTWCRYEAGGSIRLDKCKGICKALNWYGLPDHGKEKNENFSVQEYKNHEAWSVFLEREFGVKAAVSFAMGSDILYDHINEDMRELSSLPAGTHIGQLRFSWLNGNLPEQFLMNYDYEFVYRMKCSLRQMRMRAKSDLPMTAHCVMEELLIYLCNEEASGIIELSGGMFENDDDIAADSEEWVFDLFDDMDIISFLYSNVYLPPDHPYHFSHWTERQFYTD